MGPLDELSCSGDPISDIGPERVSVCLASESFGFCVFPCFPREERSHPSLMASSTSRAEMKALQLL